MHNVLFVCVDNSGLSQMAESFLECDKADKPAEKLRQIREEIQTRVMKLAIDVSSLIK